MIVTDLGTVVCTVAQHSSTLPDPLSWGRGRGAGGQVVAGVDIDVCRLNRDAAVLGAESEDLLEVRGTRFSTVQCNAVQCSAVHCTALHFTALHCTALHSNAMQ